MIWIVLLGIAVAAIALMIIPLWRRTEGAQSRAAFDAQIYRDQLTEVAQDVERSRISADQAASARTEIARRLLAVTANENSRAETAKPLTADGATAVSRGAKRGISAFVALAVPIAAFGVYMILGSPHLPTRPAAEMRAERPATRDPGQDSGQAADGAALIERLGEKLKDRPNDLRGWTLYANSLVQIGRFDEAVAAYSRVTTLAPRNAELMSRMAETQIFAAKGSVTPAARASLQATLELDAAEPRARYYLGLAESQAGKIDEALAIWISLEADSAPDAPWRAVLAERIAKLASAGKISADQLAARRTEAAAKSKTVSAPAEQTAQAPGNPGAEPGPSAEDVRAAQSMSAEDRMEMIRGMVARLADRLKEEPDDIAGWQRLARAYDVLGDAENARQAHANLARLQPNDANALADYASAIGRTMAKDDAITPELAALGERILALNPNHTGALWFTGMARAEAGDLDGARNRWTRLLALLDPNSPQYADVQKNIEALDRPSR